MLIGNNGLDIEIPFCDQWNSSQMSNHLKTIYIIRAKLFEFI